LTPNPIYHSHVGFLGEIPRRGQAFVHRTAIPKEWSFRLLREKGRWVLWMIGSKKFHRSFLPCPHLREEDDIADAFGAGEHHDEAVDPDPSRRGIPYSRACKNSSSSFRVSPEHREAKEILKIHLARNEPEKPEEK